MPDSSKRPTQAGAPGRNTKNNPTDTGSDTLSSTPPQREHKPKTKHAVGHRLHGRVPSTRALQKLKAHAGERDASKLLRRQTSTPGSPTTPTMEGIDEPKFPRGETTAATRPSTLRRNKSHGEVKKAAKVATAMKRSASHTSISHQSKSSVHFDLANTTTNGDDHDDGWTEASGSASPSLSRANSVAGASSGRNSARPPASAANSIPPSLAASPAKLRIDARDWSQHERTHSAPDAHQITSRLLQRAPSQGAAPKMSTVSATAVAPGTSQVSDLAASSGSATPHTDSHKSELISRFKGSGSGTPGDTSPFLQSHHPTSTKKAEAANGAAANESDAANFALNSRRAKSMSNLKARGIEPDDSSDDDRALAPRSRKSSTHYIPPQQSRTQQKLWLQRASSNIEPAQLAPAGALGLGLGGLPVGMGMGMGMGLNVHASPLVGSIGSGYGPEGGAGDPRIRMQLEKTGSAFMVVRRHQDPIAKSVRRLLVLPGGEKGRRIPGTGRVKAGKGVGLSQSLREGRSRGGLPSGSLEEERPRASFEVGSPVGSVEGGGDDDGLAAILRGLWEKGPELSSSS
ncbi:hypothetical protein VE01_10349 [Pseudogymnoascus verrucosus]|uniref:Uncharacterized protein n=1 Tax=Pseudogymnoascus verrucosus TaxID=342668 RepID=A0A1B8G753_9PEZI|nr:uncharacterized protein VE01_10349 [Pseudogymnoascus verrucosus]OBT91657.1 hypothetical protein VE01_10349 [Pseudogymnoascus verrucosus]